MTFSDIIAMSVGNLWRRKLRTCLTILGVLIGTSSIVAMLSIALGMKQMVMDEYSSYGSATQITVRQGYSDSDSGAGQDKLLTDSNIEKIAAIEHVDKIAPSLTLDVTLKQGNYTGWTQIIGVSKEVMEEQTAGQGRLPNATSSGALELLVGNTVITQFYNTSSEDMAGYYETGELPDVDLLNKQTMAFTYNSNPESDASDSADTSGSEAVDTTDGDVMGSDSMPRIQIKVAGIMEGEPDSYSQYSYYTLVDNDSLKSYLSKNFRKGHIPGQPLDSHGKAYNEWIYNQATVDVDDGDNVEAVTKAIQDMGFQAESNKELLESAQGVFRIIELVLGGIGMIAFLVAAIGIANTMMMSTYERTKEIGVMKVLGCDMKDILAMFLSEAGCIGLIGGVVGLGFTMILSAVANALLSGALAETMGLPEGSKLSLIPLWLALAAIVFATLMGMIAGFFPARRAMKLSPLAAIRNE